MHSTVPQLQRKLKLPSTWLHTQTHMLAGKLETRRASVGASQPVLLLIIAPQQVTRSLRCAVTRTRAAHMRTQP